MSPFLAEPVRAPRPRHRRNPALAETIGINTGLMRAGLFAIGSAIAGLAGAMLAPINTLNPQFGLLFLVNSFLVVILGGKGSLRGLVMAGVVLGGALSILQFVISTVYAQIIMLAIAILGVRLRPVLMERIASHRERRSSARGPVPVPLERPWRQRLLPTGRSTSDGERCARFRPRREPFSCRDRSWLAAGVALARPASRRSRQGLKLNAAGRSAAW